MKNIIDAPKGTRARIKLPIRRVLELGRDESREEIPNYDYMQRAGMKEESRIFRYQASYALKCQKNPQ